MAQLAKPRVIGMNHVAIEVGDIDEALAFYGRLFSFELRGKCDSMAFIDLGDQFIALLIQMHAISGQNSFVFIVRIVGFFVILKCR